MWYHWQQQDCGNITFITSVMEKNYPFLWNLALLQYTDVSASKKVIALLYSFNHPVIIGCSPFLLAFCCNHQQETPVQKHCKFSWALNSSFWTWCYYASNAVKSQMKFVDQYMFRHNIITPWLQS